MKNIALIIPFSLVSLGTYWAMVKGGHDFNVFYHAWGVALRAHAHEIYTYGSSPDRFLYAPGFAWVLSFLALIPKKIALLIWCLVKALLLGLVVKRFDQKKWAACLGLLFVARPLLIDFQYGQVNIFILCLAMLALDDVTKKTTHQFLSFFKWFLLAIVAFSKIYALVLLCVPWVLGRAQKYSAQKAGLVFGLVFIVVLPAFFVGYDSTIHLYRDWWMALSQKGMPFDSHNQSFVNFLHHVFGGVSIPIMFLERKDYFLAPQTLSLQTIQLLSTAYFFMTASLLSSVLFLWERLKPAVWMALLISMVILPAHLVWKPYFVFIFPLAALVVENKKPVSIVFLFALFALLNLTSFDLIGIRMAAILESSAVFLWVHWILVFWVLLGALKSRQLLPLRASGLS